MSNKKDKGRKWDGKSRVSTDKYRKRWNEIFKRNETSAKVFKEVNKNEKKS